MNLFTFTKKKAAVLAAMAATTLVSGVAFAAWTADGTGSGYAKARTANAVTTVDVSGTASAALYPGGSADLVLSIANNNPFPVTVTAVTNDAAHSISSGDATCDAANSVTFTNTSGLSQVVAANSTGTVITGLTNKVAMSSASVDACQGKTFTIPVSVAAHS